MEKIRENINKDTLMILACGPSAHYCHKTIEETDCDVWTCNSWPVPSTTLHFQIHHKDTYTLHEALCAEKSLYNMGDAPIVIHPTTRKWFKNVDTMDFPLKEMQEYFKFDWREILLDIDEKDYPKYNIYLACTPAYMLGLAIATESYKRIMIYGVDVNPESRVEATFERPCIEWYMGYAKALCNLTGAPKVQICSKSFLFYTQNFREMYV